MEEKELKKNIVQLFLSDEEAVGVVEIILILVILIALVLLFKNKITQIVNKAFKSITDDSGDILE